MNTASDAQVTPIDGPPADACVPETETQLCTRIGNVCEIQTSTDNCGTERTVSCGSCGAGLACVVGQCQTPECGSFGYTSAALPAFSVASTKDTLGGATWDARTILYIKSAPSTCGGFTLSVADEMVAGSDTYTQSDATTRLETLGVAIGENAFSITADGLTLIAVDRDGARLVSTTRSARGVVDFDAGNLTAFEMINASIPVGSGVRLNSPTISADGLELFYTVDGHGGPAAVKNGIYSAVRLSTGLPFPAGSRLLAPINNGSNGFISGVSADRLTVFVFNSFQSWVYTRRSTSQAFTNPNAPAPVVSGWNHRVLAGCNRLLAMVSVGGCQNEDIHTQTRQ